VGKSYLALVHGNLTTSGTIESPIAHAAGNAKRMEVHITRQSAERAKARPAVTRFHPVKGFGEMTLVGVRIRTGVRHQVRVHLASIRHPIVGDELYAPAAAASARHDVPRRLLLHARQLRFTHPNNGKPVRLVASMPADLRLFLALLEEVWSSSSRAAESPLV
jgi:23S rRNA pseudouridine1911/1915/1917 synthase